MNVDYIFEEPITSFSCFVYEKSIVYEQKIKKIYHSEFIL